MKKKQKDQTKQCVFQVTDKQHMLKIFCDQKSKQLLIQAASLDKRVKNDKSIVIGIAAMKKLILSLSFLRQLVLYNGQRGPRSPKSGLDRVFDIANREAMKDAYIPTSLLGKVTLDKKKMIIKTVPPYCTFTVKDAEKNDFRITAGLYNDLCFEFKDEHCLRVNMKKEDIKKLIAVVIKAYHACNKKG